MCMFGARDTNRATSAILIRQIWSAVYVCSVASGSERQSAELQLTEWEIRRTKMETNRWEKVFKSCHEVTIHEAHSLPVPQIIFSVLSFPFLQSRVMELGRKKKASSRRQNQHSNCLNKVSPPDYFHLISILSVGALKEGGKSDRWEHCGWTENKFSARRPGVFSHSEMY